MASQLLIFFQILIVLIDIIPGVFFRVFSGSIVSSGWVWLLYGINLSFWAWFLPYTHQSDGAEHLINESGNSLSEHGTILIALFLLVTRVKLIIRETLPNSPIVASYSLVRTISQFFCTIIVIDTCLPGRRQSFPYILYIGGTIVSLLFLFQRNHYRTEKISNMVASGFCARSLSSIYQISLSLASLIAFKAANISFKATVIHAIALFAVITALASL